MQDHHQTARRLLPQGTSEDIVEKIAKFIPIANDSILRDSLKEAIGRPKKGVTAITIEVGAFIDKVHKAYNRRLAEMGRLYPLFNIFESSFRSFLAHTMDEVHGSSYWWKPAYDIEILRSDPHHHSDPGISHIGTLRISLDLSNAVHDFARSIAMSKEARILVDEGGGTMDLIQFTKLNDLERLIGADWIRIKDSFAVAPSFGVTTFLNQFEKVRHARNKIFHHRDISEKAAIVTIAEELLDLIGVHLKSLYEDAAHVAVSPYHFVQDTASSYHYALSITRYSFTVTAHFGEKAAEVRSEGTCSGDAIVRYLHSLKAARIGDLHQLQSKLLTVS
ncbi:MULTISPECIES: hypothetical protein [Rhizobium]|uniref:RiboL-PSP-HEPN domain-containing protein n=1 Tax=Rhizobium rhododendri TaxID=2506430 RepID=A0ABY8IS94_9HYPH|nr:MULTISPECIES: hypothetical protein [Rhizobium]TQX82146.1 hypothetical protein EQW76_28205 [Rhizobium sp. rho-13.1]TQY09415.1 hypothetical protein EQW74_21310 [Rhizobium sp. rho-1.1]WFS25895.1 hypothetical protein PR018_20470 [Rhizobium rhododendri]